MFRSVLIDITGGCNAKCPLCVTGREHFGKRLEFMPVPQFARTLDRLLELDLIDRQQGLVGLHNWGEPILHPNLNEIAAELNARGLRWGFSTNASKRANFNVPTTNCGVVTFSVPGWSQASQDRIHGLSHDRVVANILATVENLRATGCTGSMLLAFHVYQFNIYGEVEEAREWCQRHGLSFNPVYAYINDYTQATAFLRGTMATAERDRLSRNIFLHYVEDHLAKAPADYQCWQWDGQLTLNHKSDVMVCCVLPYSMPAASLGSVFNLTREQIISGKTTSKECDDCLSCGLAWWANSAIGPDVGAAQHRRKTIPRTPRNAYQFLTGQLRRDA